MSRIDWYLEGVQFGNCSCTYGCPCQFEDLPTDGHCRGFDVVHIDKGHFGNTTLDGLCAAIMYAWPGPIFEGKGDYQVIIDERADDTQREALAKIMHGEETVEASNHWWVFHAMSDTVHEPLSKRIDFEVDMDARKARVSIPDLIESRGNPIVSPVTGEEHRVRINMPDGIEFEVAEIGSASTRSMGAIELDLNDSYGQFSRIRHTGDGIVRL